MGEGSQSEGKALPDTACPPSSTETAEPRKKAHGERDANKQSCSLMWEMSEVSIGFEAQTFVIYKIKSFFIDCLKELHILRIHNISGTVLGDVSMLAQEIIPRRLEREWSHLHVYS